MSLTVVATGGDNAALVVSRWGQQVLIQAGTAMFWDRWGGPEGSNAPIIRRDELTREKGEKVKIDFLSRLSGSGVSGETALSGSEEAMTFYQLDVTVALRRNAVARHEVSQQKTMHDLRAAGARVSGIWIGEQIDNDIFDKLDAQTTNRLYGGDATSKATIEAGDLMTPALITKARWQLEEVNAQKVIVDGQAWYLGILSNWQAAALMANSDWRQYQREAGVRGMDNPLFRGALGAWDGVMLFANDRVERGANAGAGGNINYAIAHFVGANAVGFAWAMLPTMIEEIRDFESIYGVGAKAMWGCAAAVFNSVPIGHVPVMSSTADPT